MEDVEVSIVTPSYNQADFIRDNLDSVKNQSVKSLEHIVMDGESTDGTVNILREYEDVYNLCWFSDSDDGQSDAINKGVNEARGSIIGWLNSDDAYVDKHTISRVVGYFDDNPDVDVIYGDMARMNKDSLIKSVISRPNFRPEFLKYSYLIPQPSTFFRANVMKDNPLNTGLNYIMDWEYWIRLSKKYDFKYVPSVFSAIRKYPEQKSSGNESYNEIQVMAEELGIDMTYKRDIIAPLLGLYSKMRSMPTALKFYRQKGDLPFNGNVVSLPRLMINSLLPSSLLWEHITYE